MGKGLKYLFIVQGEGRGHLTQAMALEKLLTENGHQVVGMLVGKSQARQLPEFFTRAVSAPVQRFDSVNFQPSSENRTVNMLKSVMYNVEKFPQYLKSVLFLKDAIKKLTRYDESGNVVQWGARFDLNRPSPITSVVPFIWQAGGDILDADGNVIVDSAETREALSFIKSLYDEGYVQKSNITGGGIPFSSGEIGIELQKEPNEIKKYSDENPNLNFRVGPILENKEKVGYITSGCYAMFSGAKNNEAAITWLKFITNNDNITRLLSDSGFMSPKSDINESDYMTDDRYLMIASQSEWATGTGPMNIHYSEILTACGQTFNAIILGEKDMDQGLAELKAQLEQIMAE